MFRLFLFLAIVAFGYALFLPVYAEKPDLQAYWALIGGWMVGTNDIPTAVSWFANVTFFMSVIMILRRKKPKPMAAFVFAILSLVFACFFLAAGKAYLGAGASATVGKLSTGTAFYLWAASFLLMAIAAWLKMKSLKPASTSQDPSVIDEPHKS